MFRSFDPDPLSRLTGVYQGAGTGTPLDTVGYSDASLVASHGEDGGSSSAT